MRNNYLGGSTATGGTSTLTLSAAAGLALPSNALIDGQMIEYSVVEYTDSTLATISKSESGFGLISASNVLTRSAPRVTWNGTTYSQNAPSALSFGTSNVRVLVSPIAEGGPTSFPARANFNAVYGYGPNEWLVGANLSSHSADYSAFTFAVGDIYYVPIKIESGHPIATLAVAVTTASAGNFVNTAIAAPNPANGLPGAILLAANSLSTTSAVVVSQSVTGRILSPGWYWSLFTSNGTGSIRGSDSATSSPIGALGATGVRLTRYVRRSKTHADFVVGADAFSGTSGSPAGVVNLAAPLVLWR